MAEEEKVFRKLLNGGMDSNTAPEDMAINKIRYALNCITSSPSEAEQGIITNPKGNTLISVELPEGRNKVIGNVADEENNRFLYALWNSNGFHTWFMYDSVSNSITRLLQNKRDSNNEDILYWQESDIILGINIIDGDKLYWTVYGSDQHAGKLNISKVISRQDPGYDDVIHEEYILAFKQPPAYAPEVVYFTNPDLKSNNVYRNLFKFATRYIYDDYEYSTFSDYSDVAIPDEEDVTGTKGVPLINNGIKVKFLTGPPLVRKIELIMKKTNQDVDVPNSENDWVSLVVLDKTSMEIPDNTQYEYDFYNDHSYLSIFQEEVIQPFSDLPDFPKAQEYSGNVLFYGKFKSGHPVVRPDMDISVEYDDLFVPDSTENVPNNPSFVYNKIRDFHESDGWFGKGWNHREGEIVVGSDVKSGNVFVLTIDKSGGNVIVLTRVASLNDTASTIASYFRGQIASMSQATQGGGYVGDLVSAGGGAFKFSFDMWNNAGKPYIIFTTSVTPVNYSKLKDTGNSVRNEKLGSAFRYGIIYESVKTSKKSLVYVDTDNLISIKNLNELGAIKKVSTFINIHHKAPEWAQRYQIVRTKNLVKNDYIQVLIQSKAKVTDSESNELYQDLMIGSLFTYQKIHASNSLRYEFKKGDRVRLLKTYTETGGWIVETNVIDYEVIDYFPIVENDIDANASISGDNKITVGDTPDPNNIGSYIRVNNTERLIIGIDGAAYLVEFPFSEITSTTDTNRTYPTYTIINKRGVLRIKENPLFPIDIITGEKYALVEVYNPSQTFENAESENYYEIGYKFDILNDNGVYLHRGNVVDQTSTVPARIKIEGFDNYVRNRQLPVNNAIKNTQVIYTSVEDGAFSDFYVSDLTSYGRVNRLDDSRGVVDFDESIIHSQNRIEGTKVNGLSMFRNINRRDYNDKYGSIQRLMFHNGILYILKFLKTNYVPVNSNIITDTSGGTRILTASDDVIPRKLEDIPWEDGVGRNPESAFRWGNNIFLICPNTAVVLRISGGSGEVVSTPLNFDKDIIDNVTLASISGAKIIGGYDPYLKMCVWNIEGFDVIAFKNGWFPNNTEFVEIEVDGDWNIVSGPSHGTIEYSNDTYIYFPNTGYSGLDNFSYRSGSGEVRNVVINVLEEDTQLVWKPDGESCVMESNARTGYVEYSILKQFDNITQEFTGITKPNDPEDVDYIPPVLDEDRCPIGIPYIYLATINRRLSSQSISFYVQSVDQINLIFKEGSNFDTNTIVETGLVNGGNHTLDLTVSNSDAYLFIVADNMNYGGITQFVMRNAYVSSANFNEIPSLLTLILDQFSIPFSNNNQFTSLSIGSLGLLKRLEVIRHEITNIDLTSNPLIETLDVSYGRNLNSMTIGGWPSIKSITVHECLLTSIGFNPSFVNSLINKMSISASSRELLKYGLSYTDGIKPSTSAISDYNTLVSVGVRVVGKPPHSTYESAFMSYGAISNNKVDYNVYLSQPLSVNVVVRIEGRSLNGSIWVPVSQDQIILANTTSASGTIDFGSFPMSQVELNIGRVIPNPAGGTVIVF